MNNDTPWSTRVQQDLDAMPLREVSYEFVERIHSLPPSCIIHNALQYANEKHLKALTILNSTTLEHLDPSQSYLNIGTGAGLVEWSAQRHNYNLDTVEWKDCDITYTTMRDILGIKVDYYCNNVFSKKFKINNIYNKYDTILLIRFEPIQDDNKMDQEAIQSLFEELFCYSDKVLIVTHITPEMVSRIGANYKIQDDINNIDFPTYTVTKKDN